MNNLQLITSDQKFGFCMVPISPVRSEAKDVSEISTQLLFGEPVIIISLEESWVRIKTFFDQYKGYVDVKHLLPLSESSLKEWKDNSIFQYEFIKDIQTPWGKQITSRGSFVGKTTTFKIGNYAFSQSLNLNQTKRFSEICKELLNTSYLWGGKSVFGIDCSGFVQMIFRLLGIDLPRDAYQQAEIGSEVNFSDCFEGDIAYFVNKQGKIIHVGIILENYQIIHASGRVRIDQLTETGIYNSDYQKQTHQLCFIKRIKN